MTAHHGTAEQKKCHDSGMDGYVAKPISVGALREVISEHGHALEGAD